MKTAKLLTLAAGLSLFLVGCTGPAGPEGPAGNDGVANITFNKIDVTDASWTTDVVGASYEATYTVPAITAQTSNEVVAYFSLGYSGPWQALPANNAVNSGDQITYAWTLETITFFYDYTTFTNPLPSDLYFNVCVIPPAIAKKYPNVNFKDPNAAMAVPEFAAALKSSTVIVPTRSTAVPVGPSAPAPVSNVSAK